MTEKSLLRDVLEWVRDRTRDLTPGQRYSSTITLGAAILMLAFGFPDARVAEQAASTPRPVTTPWPSPTEGPLVERLPPLPATPERGPAVTGPAPSGTPPADVAPPAGEPIAGEPPTGGSPPPQAPPSGAAIPPLPQLPEPLRPLGAVLAPLVTTGCSYFGLVGVATTLGGIALADVPLDQLTAALRPVYDACLLFGFPEVRTICPADDQVAAQAAAAVGQLGLPIGLPVTPPPVLGLAIDSLDLLEQAFSALIGAALPSVATQLRDQLECRQA